MIFGTLIKKNKKQHKPTKLNILTIKRKAAGTRRIIKDTFEFNAQFPNFALMRSSAAATHAKHASGKEVWIDTVFSFTVPI